MLIGGLVATISVIVGAGIVAPSVAAENSVACEQQQGATRSTDRDRVTCDRARCRDAAQTGVPSIVVTRSMLSSTLRATVHPRSIARSMMSMSFVRSLGLEPAEVDEQFLVDARVAVLARGR